MLKGISLKLFVVGGILLASSAYAQSGRVVPTPTPEETVRVKTEEIKLNVLAFNEEGEFVTDVKESDLVITENNVLHQPSSVRRMTANVLIMMDTGGELRTVKSLDRTRKAAAGVVSALNSEDSVAVLQYSDKAQIVGEWTRNKSEAYAAIGRTSFGRRSAFTKAIELARNFLTKSSLENKHLVLISDGTDSFVDHTTKQRAMRSLLATDVTVHVLSYTRLEANEITPRTKAVSNTPPRRPCLTRSRPGCPMGPAMLPRPQRSARP
jgi:Mg-chelatase subunit ChlD